MIVQISSCKKWYEDPNHDDCQASIWRSVEYDDHWWTRSLMNPIVTKMDNYFPVYIHVPKLEPSGKKGKFVGYRKSSKDYKVYIPGSSQIEANRDVTFEEEMAIQKRKRIRYGIRWRWRYEIISPPNIKRVSEEMNKPISPIDPVELDDSPTDMEVSWKRTIWAG